MLFALKRVLGVFCAAARTLMTRQPVEGRARNGGLRVGEMEADCLKAHGAAHILQDRLCFSSDCTAVPVCSMCGNIAEPHRPRLADHHVRAREMYCRLCDSSAHVRVVNMPYAMLLFIREMMTASIVPVLKLTQDGPSTSSAGARKWTVSRFRQPAENASVDRTDVLEYHPPAHKPDAAKDIALQGVQSAHAGDDAESLSAAFSNPLDSASSGAPQPVSCTTPPRRPRAHATVPATDGVGPHRGRDERIKRLLSTTPEERRRALVEVVAMLNRA